jgi:hypothetical protein
VYSKHQADLEVMQVDPHCHSLLAEHWVLWQLIQFF